MKIRQLKKLAFLVFMLSLCVGCSKSPEKIKSEIKSQLHEGDAIVYEDDDNITLSLNNGKYVVNHNFSREKVDTLYGINSFINEPYLRGAHKANDKIMLVGTNNNDSLYIASYDIKNAKLNSMTFSAVSHRFNPESGELELFCLTTYKNGNRALASYNVNSELQVTSEIYKNIKEFYVAPKAVQAPKKKAYDPWDIGAFLRGEREQGDGHVYWWQCLLCSKTVQSATTPPYSGCTGYSSGVGRHSWSKGGVAR